MPTNSTFNRINKKINNLESRTILCSAFATAFVIICLSLGLIFALSGDDTSKVWAVKRKISSLLLKTDEYPEAVVSADGLPCPTIGKDVLLENGTAMDSAIATLFCLGVVNAQSMGLGGGFFLTYYNRTSNTAYSLDAREVAPGAAYKDMYDGNGELSTYGGLAVAVPGEMRGYWDAYQKFGGGVTWARLIEPTIMLCEEGHPVNSHMANALAIFEGRILAEPSMKIFVNPTTNQVWKEGDILHRPILAQTLRSIQEDPDSVHTGLLANDFIQDLQHLGSIITHADLGNYKPVWRDPYPMEFSNNYTLYSTPPPGSGLILGFIMRILQHYNFTSESINTDNITTTYQRITEAFKFAYARRTELGDMDFSDMIPLINDLLSDEKALEAFGKIQDNATSQDPIYYGSKYSLVEDHGTSHISIVGPNGDAVSITSTINLYFGAGIMSNSTGIVLNNEMNDFSIPGVTNIFDLPPFEANYIEPGKRPVSSMCPVVIVDEVGEVVLVNGAAGGTRISSAVAWSSIHNMWFGADIKEAIDSRRIHHQLYPMELSFETGFDEALMTSLEEIGHVTNIGGASSVTGIERMENGGLRGNSDARKGGGVDGF